MDADGTEVLVYDNDTADLICCTEIESFDEPARFGQDRVAGSGLFASPVDGEGDENFVG